MAFSQVSKQANAKRTMKCPQQRGERSPTSRDERRPLTSIVLTLNVAKCNLGKVNLELMLPAVSPSLHMIRGGAPLEFAGGNYVQPCLLAIVAITASVSESLQIH